MFRVSYLYMSPRGIVLEGKLNTQAKDEKEAASKAQALHKTANLVIVSVKPAKNTQHEVAL
jgi:hypothetical protein